MRAKIIVNQKQTSNFEEKISTKKHEYKHKKMRTVTSVRDRVIETVKPKVTTVVEKTAPVLTSAIEGTIR